MSVLANELRQAVREWDQRELARPKIVVVAGSGLSVHLGEVLAGPFDLESLLPFPIYAVEGHPLSYELVSVEPLGPVLYFRGRLHAYQGFDASQVVFCVRLAAMLGAQAFIVTNASGGLYRGAKPGHLALIRDQINLTGLNPLRGRLPSDWGPQFPDMIDAYDPLLRRVALREAERLGIELRSGIYVGVLGPSYETPAEIAGFRRLGADVVGMSTVLETIAARHLGLRCFGLSLVTNPAAGTQREGEPMLDHGDVLEVSKRAARDVEHLLAAMLLSPELTRPSNATDGG